MGEVQLAFVHHTVTDNYYEAIDSATIVASIQRYHRNVLGWNDIGYNALVDQFGQIFEGRAGGLDNPVIGAQAEGFNSVSTGVALIGDFSSESPTPEAIAVLSKYLAWKLSVHRVKPTGKVAVISAGGESNRYPNGEEVLLPRISGHRKACTTACPGRELNRLLPEVVRRVTRKRVNAN